MKSEDDISDYEVAKAFYALPLGDRTFKNLASRLGITAGSTKAVQQSLSRIIRRQEERGLIQHYCLRDSWASPPYPQRVPHLEDRLHVAYGIRHAIVVEPRNELTGATESENDLVHKDLGLWAANLILAIVRSGDGIAVSGGRGAYYTADALRTLRRHRIVSLSLLMSACGRMGENLWNPGDIPGMSANDVISAFAAACGAADELIPVNSSIAASLPKRARDDFLKAPEKVTICLSGIGTLTGEHVFLRKPLPLELKEIQKEITQLKKAVREASTIIGSDAGQWLGHYCGYLFFFPRRGFPPKSLEEISRVVTKLNNRCISFHRETIEAIAARGAAIVVAGGKLKARFLHRLLSTPGLCTHLVTDVEAAEQMIEPSE